MYSGMQQSLKQFYQKNKLSIPTVFSNSDLRSFLNQTIKYISPEDFKHLYEDLAKEKSQFTKEEASEIYFHIETQAKKVYNRVQPPISLFLFESLIKISPGQQKQQPSLIVVDKSSQVNENKIDISRSFSNILSEDYLKKLINMGANGLINQKQEQKVNKYFYNHWIETNQSSFLVTQTEKLQVQLLKSVWTFDFQKAFSIGQSIYQKTQSPKTSDQQKYVYAQVSSIIPALQNLSEIAAILQKNPPLRLMIEGRPRFQIQFKEQLLRKSSIIITNPQEMSILLENFNELYQLWTFTQEYFEMIQNQLQNPYFKQVAMFISSNRDDKQKSDEEIEDWVKLQDIGIIQRFLYAKKYFSSDSFQLFKNLVKQKSQPIAQIDYILLFGNKKQSEKILQNYLDQTNQIQKVALISVYLKTFSEQAKIMSTLRSEQKSFYSKFIYVYEWLLDKVDGGISRHVFDKKCLSIQIQRKRKNLTKTYTFDCTNCKAQQIYSVLSKKINIDSKQPKLKGYHYFAKDNRTQIMHCIQCMIMLPKCSICLYPISVFNAYAEEMKRNASQKKATNKGQPINRAVVWCPKCKHGGHFDHIMEWFSQEKRKCPVANCKCKCSI